MSELRRTAQLTSISMSDDPDREQREPGWRARNAKLKERIEDDIKWIIGHWQRKDVRDRLGYAHWLRSAKDPATGGYPDDVAPVGLGDVFDGWLPPGGHPYLGGLLEIARTFAAQRDRKTPGLLVIGELSEELGSFRSKIALQLNEALFGRDDAIGYQAQTADIGLRVLLCIGKPDTSVRVRCSTCDLDNDLAPSERVHMPRDIREVCVKGENEGMFYNCREHDPAAQPDDPTFIEKLERYDIFGR
jgi:hypothetical protein